MDKKTLSSGQSLVSMVAKNDLSSAVFGVAEVALDRNLIEGVVKDLPIVGILVNLAKAGQSISEAMFIRKLERFLVGMKDVPIVEREKLLAKYPDCSAEQRVLGENLLLALGVCRA